MPTGEQLESAPRNADAAGDKAAAKRLANAVKNSEYGSPSKPWERFKSKVETKGRPWERFQSSGNKEAQPTQPEADADSLPEEDRGILGAVSDFFTGNDRATAETEALPEFDLPMIDSEAGVWDNIKRQGSLAKTALGLLTSFDAEQQANVLRSNFPELTFSEDEKGNVIVDGSAYGGGKGVLNMPGVSARDLLQAGFQVALFTPAGRVAAAGPTLRSQAMRGAAASGATETLQSSTSAATGSGISAEDAIRNMGIASAFGGLAPAVAKALTNAGRPIKNVILDALDHKISVREIPVFNANGTFTDDAIRELRKAGTSPDELDDLVRAQLKRDGVLTPEQIERFNLFKKAGVQPTRANLTQSADDFQVQQEAIKRSGPMRSVVDAQDQQLTGAVDDFASSTGGVTDDAFDAGESVFQAVTKKATTLDDQINQLYSQARNAAQGEKVVSLSNLTDKLNQVAPQNQLSNGVVRAVVGDLKSRGILGEGMKLQGRIDINTAEEVRKVINQFRADANPAGRRILDQLKESLDDDVLRTAGRDVFKQARNAYSNFKKELSLASRSKFDQKTGSIVEDILTGKVEPEQLLKKTVTNTSASVRDLQKLKDYLLSGTDEQIAIGTQAWNDLRGQTVRHMLGKAIGTAGKGEGGQPVFNGNNFRKELERIGPQKLKTLFGDDYRKLLEIAEVGKLRIPVSMTQQGKGPTAQAVSELGNSIPIIGRVIDIASGVGDNIAERAAVNPGAATERALRNINRILITGQPRGEFVSAVNVGAQTSTK